MYLRLSDNTLKFENKLQANNGKLIHYSQTEPSTNKNDYYWFETDADNNPIYAYSWVWDNTENGWKSPIQYYNLNYRQEYDKTILAGGNKHIIRNIAWSYYPVGTPPTNIWLDLSTPTSAYQVIVVNTTSNPNQVNSGRNENINLVIQDIDIFQFRWASNNDYAYIEEVWGDIRVEYVVFR